MWSTFRKVFGNPVLHSWLDREPLRGMVICGITTEHCCETTARVASDLGYDVVFVSDATHTFDRIGPDGEVVPVEVVHSVSEASLHRGFAQVVSTTDLLGGEGSSLPVTRWCRQSPLLRSLRDPRGVAAVASSRGGGLT